MLDTKTFNSPTESGASVLTPFWNIKKIVQRDRTTRAQNCGAHFSQVSNIPVSAGVFQLIVALG